MTMGIGNALRRSAERHADRLALSAKGEDLTYDALLKRSDRMARALTGSGFVRPGDRVAILSDRTLTAYTGIAAAVLADTVYVPLNPRFPVDRNRAILLASDARAIIVDDRNASHIPDLLDGIAVPPVVLTPESEKASIPRRFNRLPYAESSKPTPEVPASSNRDGDDLVYILFTSGSTGAPKGVPISHRNLKAYVENASALAGVTHEDRIIQLADLTFDISVHDMFVCWLNGASLYSVPEQAGLMSYRFVEEHQITGWFSVPSTAGLLKQAGVLTPGSMPSMRFTYFCGEALTGAVAEAWAAAAPNAMVFNLYGPTEATVAYTSYRYLAGQEEPPAVVPLGHPFPGQQLGLFDAEGSRTPLGEVGELCLAGTQVMSGYWESPTLNEARFLLTGGQRWFRTGDLGRYDTGQGYIFAGRVDHQVKILGYRVELQEIETVIRAASERDVVAVVPWPASEDGGALGTVAFVSGPPGDSEALRIACRQKLPDYMIPGRIIYLSEIPMNTNGKVDYPSLKASPLLRPPGS